MPEWLVLYKQILDEIDADPYETYHNLATSVRKGLRYMRERAGLSLEDMASGTPYTPRSFRDFEEGEEPVSAVLLCYAVKLGEGLDDLLSFSVEAYPTENSNEKTEA